MPVRSDRADIVHEAGRRRLSPALRDGAPALVRTGDAAGRCGWAEFFAALEHAGLAVEFDPVDEATVRFVARGAAHASRPSLGDRARAAFAEARRFAAALRGRPKAS
jgi:hypothetical protein